MGEEQSRRDDELALLRRWTGGDARAGRTLIARYYRQLFRFFVDKVGPDAAEDLTQATFEVLCSKKETFRGDSSVRTYLFGVARFKLIHHVRRVGAHREAFDPSQHSVDLPEVTRSMTSMFAAREREALVISALHSLPLDDRLILEMRHFEGLTIREIAASFEVPLPTMAHRIERARTRLQGEVDRLARSAASVAAMVAGLDTSLSEVAATLRAATEPTGLPT